MIKSDAGAQGLPCDGLYRQGKPCTPSLLELLPDESQPKRAHVFKGENYDLLGDDVPATGTIKPPHPRRRKTDKLEFYLSNLLNHENDDILMHGTWLSDTARRGINPVKPSTVGKVYHIER